MRTIDAMHLKYGEYRPHSDQVALVTDRVSSWPRHEGYRAGDPQYRRIAVALFAAGVATFALLYSTQALLPVLARAFSLSAGQSTLSLSLTTAGLGAALLVTGPVSEALGRTRLIHLSLVASGLVALACAVAPSWDALLGLRLVQGITLAGLPAVATAYLREETHPSTYSRAAGLYIGGTALGGLTGRLVTSTVADAAGWRWALAAIAAVGLACAAVVLFTLPPSRNFTPAPIRAGPLAAMTRRAVSDPGLLALYAIGGCSMGAFVTIFNAMGFRLAAAPFRLSAGAAGLIFLVYPVGSVSSAVAGRLASRFSRRAVVSASCLLAAAGVLVTWPGSLPAIVAGLALLTAGFFGVHSVVSGWVPARAHAGGIASGQAASLYLFAYYLGSSVFGTLAGPAWSLGGWPAVVALALVLFLACGLLTGWLWHLPSRDGPAGLARRSGVSVELARGGAEGTPEGLDERARVGPAAGQRRGRHRRPVREQHQGVLQPELGAPLREAHPRVLPEQPAQGPLGRAHHRSEFGQRPLVSRVRPQQGGDGSQPVVGERRQPDRQLTDPAELVERDLLHGRALPLGVRRAVAGERDDDLAQQRADLKHGRASGQRRTSGGRRREGQRPELHRAVRLVRVRHSRRYPHRTLRRDDPGPRRGRDREHPAAWVHELLHVVVMPADRVPVPQLGVGRAG